MRTFLTLLLFASSCYAQVTVTASRPRVRFDSAHRAWIAAKKTGTAADQAQWTAFVNYVNTWFGVSQPVNAGKQGGAFEMAVAYMGDPVTFGGARAEKGCQWLKYTVDRDDGDTGGALDADGDINDNNAFRWNAPNVAVAWDVLHDTCDALDPTIGTKVRALATAAWNLKKPGAPQQLLILTTPFRVNNNIGIGQLNALVHLLVSAYEPGVFEEPATWLATLKTAVMDAYVVPCHTVSSLTEVYHVCYGGASTEGMSDYGPEAIHLTIDMYDVWRVGTDVDFSSAFQTFCRYSLDWAMYGTAPAFVQGTYNALYRPFNYRDVLAISSAYHGMFQVYQRQMIGRIWWHFYRTGDTTRRDYAQFWSRSIDPVALLNNPPASANAGVYNRDVLYQDPNAAGVDYRTADLPLDYTTPSMLLSRSDWTTNATYFGIIAMIEGSDHMHGDGGTFSIARKGRWLTKEIPGYYNVRNINPNGVHNTLTMNGHGSFSAGYVGPNGRPGTYVKSPNNGTNGFRRRSGGYMANCNTGYCSGELEIGAPFRFTGSSITADVEDARRNFIYFKTGDVWVIGDRVKYVTGVSARTIFHLQSEKGAATIDGGVATISNADQRLHVTPVAPSTFGFLSVRLDTLYVVDVHLRTNDTAALYFDGSGLPTTVTSVALTGFTGVYSVLNTTLSCANQAAGTTSGYEPFADGAAYSVERLVCTSAGLFAGLPAYDPRVHGYGKASQFARDMRWNEPEINPASPTAVVTHDPYRIDITGDRGNAETFMVVLQGADSVDPIMPVTPLTVGTGNAVAGSFTLPGGELTEVILPKTITPTYPITFTRTGPAVTQHWLGHSPGVTYKLSDNGTATTLNTSGAGTDVVADNSGMIIASVDAGISTPTITLVATPPTLVFNCTEGGQSPFPQNVALTATGDSGEAAVSFSSDQSWATAVLSGGSAPQDTPQTMTVNIDCTGRTAGVHTATITITSATPYVVNSPTVGITLNVTAAALLAASPTSVTFAATLSGGNPSNQTLAISRTSPGDLGTITNDSVGGWLTVSPTTATYTTQQNLTLSVDITGLTAGLYTANISIPSTGASNTPLVVPVTLGVNPAVQIGLEPQVGTDRVRVRYRAPSREPCTVRACTDDSCDTEIASQSDGGGHPLRDFTLPGLTEDTPATLQTVCGTEIKARQIRTKAAGGPTKVFVIDLDNIHNAATISVNYGATPSMTETPVTGSCADGRCVATITWTNANRMVYTQPIFKNGGGATIHTGPIRSQLLVP